MARILDEGAWPGGRPPDLAGALRSTEAAFREFIDRWPDAVFVRRGPAVIHANDALLSLVGLTRGEVIGKDPVDVFVHPADRASVLEHRVRAPDDTDLRESRWVRKGGEIVHVEVVGVTILFEGSPARVCLCRDTTDRKRMQARLMVAGRMASVGTLAAGLAHEINNPLASVLANLRLLEEAGGGLLQDPRELREVVADVLAGVERVRRIVEGLRLFTHTGDAGGVRLELPRVLDTAVALASSELRARAQLVREDRDAGPVVAHEGRLVQALVELLVNAAHAIPAGCPERHEIHVETRSDGPGRAIVAVRDTGVGIAPEQLGRVFDPFFTIPGAGGGTGLGLSTCHAIVTSLGGEITVESKPGAGSTFTVRLPAVGPDRHA